MRREGIHAVLLVPEPDDPLRLLASGLVGNSSPPIAGCRTRVHARGFDSVLCGTCYKDWPCDKRGQEEPAEWVVRDVAGLWPRALVLAWEGKPVAEGLDRLRRRAMCGPKKIDEAVMRLLRGHEMDSRDITEPTRNGTPMGRLVLLNEQGREM